MLLVSGIDSTSGSWKQWQEAVVELLRADFNEVLQHIGLDEVDWPAWRTRIVRSISVRGGEEN